MGGDFIGAYFFIPPAQRPASDDELFQALGCDLARSMFGTLTFAERKLEVLSDHVCVALYFLKAEYINALSETRGQEVPLERDPLLPFATAFRDGAIRLHAEVAFLESRQPALESVLDRYWMILARDASSLAMEWFPLLYMDESMLQDWNPGPHILDRDELPGGPGRTLFSNRGRNRWF